MTTIITGAHLPHEKGGDSQAFLASRSGFVVAQVGNFRSLILRKVRPLLTKQASYGYVVAQGRR
ncbi:MAG TPA: hypothetical protein VE844_09270, partial [Gammaproteobacteria bacterium]|nr:hypothetical protein [Gammaproteobacteria bacterium]